MKKSINNYKKYIGLSIGLIAALSLFSGCSEKIDIPDATFSYGPEIGIADGNVDLSGDEPIINISDIKSPVGVNIDFLSGVKIINEDDFADLSIWADGSFIDIFTPGNYKATYTFSYNGKTVSKEINVTIYEPDVEQSASSVDNTVQNITNSSQTATPNENNTSKQTASSSSQTTVTQSGNYQEQTTVAQSGSNQEQTTVAQSSSSSNETTKTQSNSETQTTSKQNSQSTTNTTTAKNPSSSQGSNADNATSTTREIITTKSNKTTENKYIGNYTIELLSGKTITIKNSTSKYIVSTRTDVSTITKNGNTYKVKQLVIKYNTGAEQILEIMEEKIN